MTQHRPGTHGDSPRSLDRSRRLRSTSCYAQRRRRRGHLSTSTRAQRELDGAGLPDRAVLPRDHDDARAVPRLRRAAGQQHAVRAEQHRRPAADGGGGGRGTPRRASYQRRRRRARLHRARSERPRHVLRRRQQRLVPDAATIAAPANRARSAPIRASSPASRRARVKERWQWTYPIVFSPRRSERALHLARSTSGRRPTAAQTWDAISGDLTRHDPKTMGDSGGPITHDMNSPEIYGDGVLARRPARRTST